MTLDSVSLLRDSSDTSSLLQEPKKLLDIGHLSTSICKEHTEPQLIFGAIIIALTVIGLFGNLLVFFIITVLREYKKSVTNWYILQLTLADTLFLMMLPFTAHSEITGTWNFNPSLCKFKEAILFINYYASIYFLVIMSFDRYLAVTKAMTSNSLVTTLRSPVASYVISVIGWILSVLLCIQLFRYSKVNDCGVCNHGFPTDRFNMELPDCIKENGTNCGQEAIEELREDLRELEEEEYYTDYENYSYEQLLEIYESYTSALASSGNLRLASGNNSSQLPTDNTSSLNFLFESPTDHMCRGPIHSSIYLTWLYGNFFGAFVLPLLLICFFYSKIVKTIMEASSLGDSGRQRIYRRRVTLIVIALVSLFVVSWLPWFVEKLLKINGIPLSAKNCIQLTNVVRGFAYLNSALNPYFYSFLGFHFRDRLRKAKKRVRMSSSIRSRTTLLSLRRKKLATVSNSIASNQINFNKWSIKFNKQNFVSNQDENRCSITTDRRTEKTLI